MEDIVNFDILSPLISLFIFIVLIALMCFNYSKFKIWEISLLLMLSSLIIGVMSMMQNVLPFSPIIQVVFMLFQTIIFLNQSIKTSFKKGG